MHYGDSDLTLKDLNNVASQCPKLHTLELDKSIVRAQVPEYKKFTNLKVITVP